MIPNVVKQTKLLTLAASMSLIAACSSSGQGGETPRPALAEGGAAPMDGGTSTRPEGGTDSAAGGASCALTEVMGAASVSIAFVNLNPPAVAAPAMTGGEATGRFRVTKARVYLPKETASFVDPAKSTGMLTAWVVFRGNEYRLFTDIDMSISTTAGAQPVKQKTDAQGTFTASGANLVVDASCAASGQGSAPDAEYTFTNDGAALTLLIKTKVGPAGSDSYTQLDAVPE